MGGGGAHPAIAAVGRRSLFPAPGLRASRPTVPRRHALPRWQAIRLDVQGAVKPIPNVVDLDSCPSSVLRPSAHAASLTGGRTPMIPKTPPLLLTLALICDWLGWTAPLPAQDVLFPYSPSLQPPQEGDRPPWMPPPFFPFAGVEPSPGSPSWTAVRAQPSSGDRSWLADWQDSRSQRKAKGQAVVGPAILTAQTVVRDSPGTTWDDPLFKREWKTDESWRLPVLGPFFVFGQLGANGDE